VKVALVGWSEPVARLFDAALAGEGHAVTRVALDAETPRAVARATPEVVVLERHRYVDVRALLADLRAQAELAEVPVVLVGPGDPVEVPGIEVVRQTGRTLEMDALLAAVNRAAGRYAG
jgi:DNA-binding response OmpR family regulator